MFIIDSSIEKYDEIQRKESAPSRTPEGMEKNEYGERAVHNAKKFSSFLKGKVLNIGCGDGLETEALMQEGKSVVGVDLSAEKIKIAQKHGVDAHTGRMEALPFKDGEFASVYCAHALEHAYDLEKAIAEMWRVADRLVIIVPLEERGTDNEAHTSPMWSEWYLKSKVGGKIVFEEKLKTIENEYVLVVDKD